MNSNIALQKFAVVVQHEKYSRPDLLEEREKHGEGTKDSEELLDRARIAFFPGLQS